MLRIKLLVVALALTALISTPARAQTSAADDLIWPEDGASATFVTKDLSTHLVVRLSGHAAAGFRSFRGRTVSIICLPHPPASPIGTFPTIDQGPPGTAAADVRLPRHGALTLRVAIDSGDVCTVFAIHGDDAAIAYVGATDRGRTWTDELHHGLDLDQAVQVVSDVAGKTATAFPPADAVVAAGHGQIVALDAPDATPPYGSIGYWTDGGVHEVLATPSAAGRRLYIEYHGEDDSLHSNVLSQVLQNALVLLLGAFAGPGS
jgi:hypothetical protein